MKLTKDIIKKETVFDRDQIKVGDKLKVIDEWYNTEDIVEVLDVEDDEIKVKINGKIDFYSIDDIKNLRIEKAEESKLVKFKVGEKYKVEDVNSSDTYYATVMDVTDKEMCLKRDSGKFTIVQDSQIGTVYKFVKYNKYDNNDKAECEKKTDEFRSKLAKQLADEFNQIFMNDNTKNIYY